VDEARGHRSRRRSDTPKRWFDNDETASKSLGAAVSAEAMVKLLSADNLTLLHIIGTKRPDSMRALALLAHRKESNEAQRSGLPPARRIGSTSRGESGSRTKPWAA
jgi:predicted transcriptional regulator